MKLKLPQNKILVMREKKTGKNTWTLCHKRTCNSKTRKEMSQQKLNSNSKTE